MKPIKYYFDQIPFRRHTNCVKWDENPSPDLIPLWVADMDFPVAPVIQQAIQERAKHPVYGYVRVPESYYTSIIQWFSHRHHWQIPRESIIYTIGVVPAISAILQALTKPGDKVLIQSPVYNCFFSSVRNSGCQVEDCSLVRKGNTYEIDFEDFRRRAADPAVKVFILCNPHNPAGRVWTKAELEQLGDICLENNVFIIADEIHCEFVMPGYTYIPFASIKPEFLSHSATCISPSKAFNIAGLQTANIVAADPEIHARIDKSININEVCDINPFGVVALQAAYTPKGEEWLTQLNAYLYSNYQLLCDFMANYLPQFPVFKLEGTYLAWVDVSGLPYSSQELEERLLREAKVWINSGEHYGQTGFIRINLATSRVMLEVALSRIRKYIG